LNQKIISEQKNRMKQWKVMPEYYQEIKSPRVTYIVPMTPAASAAQIAMMQNRNRPYFRNEESDVVEDKAAADKAAADKAASELTMQGLMFLGIGVLVSVFLFVK
jgi:6-phosphogluconate dehydrogenase